jgi:hypothetical protein
VISVGLVIVGEVLITNVVPVPVWDVMAVAFPTDAIGPVKFAFVVTVAAFPVVDWFQVGTVPVKPA